MCTSSTQCSAGETCISGVCTKPARRPGRLPLLVALALLFAVPAHAGDDAKWRTPAELMKEVREAECDEAKSDLKTAKEKCSDAKSECTKSLKEAKKSCESRCDGDAATALAICGKQDADIVWSCRDHAIKAQETCSKGCKNTETSECKSVDNSCSGVKGAQEAKDKACK